MIHIMYSSPTIDIQTYTSTYHEQVLDHIVTIQQQEFNIPITADDQPDLKNIPEFYQSGNGNFWIALDNEQVVGTVSLLDIGARQAALRKMFVKKTYRGSDIGTAQMLLEVAMKWAEAKGIQSVYLGTTPKFKAAHRFYEKNEFQEILIDELPASFPIMKVDTKFYQYAF